MNRAQTAASLAVWKARETRYYREWRRLKKANASEEVGGKRHTAFKKYNHAHQMRLRRQMQLRKFSIQHISDEGADRIIQREGLIPWAYLDSQGYPTAWIGHLIELKRRPLTQADYRKWGSPSHPAPRKKVIDFFRNVDILPYEKVVYDANQARKRNGHPTISQQQFDACVSLTLNIGTGGFRSSTVRRRLVAGAGKKSVAAAFLMWDKPPEIRGRRRTEYKQYMEG